MTQKNQEDLVVHLQDDIRQWEGQGLEFMEDYPENAHELAKEIAAFATSNTGTIYLGVDKKGNIVGIAATRQRDKMSGKDETLNRISGVCQKTIKPAIVPKVEFIEVDDKIITKIIVPKGVEPIYFSNDIPFIRNLASSDRATPEQVKELHKRYFEGQMALSSDDETQSFLMQVLAQLSDFQIIWFDHQKRQANPDLEQMRYDSGATGETLVNLSLKSTAQQFGLAEDLLQLGETLQDMKKHRFYMDGGASWEAFTGKGDEALKLAEILLVRISKNILIQPNQVKPIKEAIATHIRELVLVWSKKDQYFLRGDLYTLKEVWRRLAFNFNRFANMPSQINALDFTTELKQIAQNLREASAGDFSIGRGFNPLDRIKSKMESTVQIAKEIYPKVED